MENSLNEIPAFENPLCKGFLDTLSEYLDDEVEAEYIDGTYEIDHEYFNLTFTLADDCFEIRHINTKGNKGMGKHIIDAIHNYADSNDVDEVIASNVVSEARGFWEKMGYVETSEDDQFIRLVQ